MEEKEYLKKGYNQEQAFALSRNPRNPKKKLNPLANFTESTINMARRKYNQMRIAMKK